MKDDIQAIADFITQDLFLNSEWLMNNIFDICQRIDDSIEYHDSIYDDHYMTDNECDGDTE